MYYSSWSVVCVCVKEFVAYFWQCWFSSCMVEEEILGLVVLHLYGSGGSLSYPAGETKRQESLESARGVFTFLLASGPSVFIILCIHRGHKWVICSEIGSLI